VSWFIQEFVPAWKSTFAVSDILVIASGPSGILANGDRGKPVDLNTCQNKMPIDGVFDLVVGELPMGLRPEQWDFDGRRVKAPLNWLYILRSSAVISPTGSGLFMVEPNALALSAWCGFEKELRRAGLHIHAVFRAPEGVLSPDTAIAPILIVLKRLPSSDLFVAELEEEGQELSVVTNYANKSISSALSEGLFVPRENFSTFDRFKTQGQIERLETQYKDYETYRLGDLAEIRAIRSGKRHVEIANAVYIPRIGNSPVVCSLDDARLKHHNYFQVVLQNKAKREYVTAFFQSELGRLILSSLTTASFIPHLNKRDLENASIALPSFIEQERIASTLAKLKGLRKELEQFANELALNPTSSKTAVGKIDSMMESIGALSMADKIRALIRKGESRELEFKETLSLDVKKQTKEKYIETASFKTVVGFLNTNGGVLLGGVDDSGGILGVHREIEKFHKKSSDKFLLHLKNGMKSRIGEQFYPYIEYRLVDVDGSQVLYIECKQGKKPCYLDGKDFYVRTNPATDKLEGPRLVEYVKAHFNG